MHVRRTTLVKGQGRPTEGVSFKLQEEPAMWWEVGAVWLHLSTGAETFLGGKPGVFGEPNAGQGGLSSWEGKSKGSEGRDSSIQELIIPPFLSLSSSCSLYC